MSSKNSIKIDVENGIYHIYNRGVGKMDIFKDKQDYGVFLSYLKECLSPVLSGKEIIKKVYIQDRVLYVPRRLTKNFKNKISLLCYCLMPNHFHLLIKQFEKGLMKKFVHSVLVRYSMYFNKKYNRVGPLFQGRYKAVLVDNEVYLVYLSKYIHRNPIETFPSLISAHSSYADYLEKRHTTWLDIQTIMGMFDDNVVKDFKKINSYKYFVEDKTNIPEFIDSITIEDS